MNKNKKKNFKNYMIYSFGIPVFIAMMTIFLAITIPSIISALTGNTNGLAMTLSMSVIGIGWFILIGIDFYNYKKQ